MRRNIARAKRKASHEAEYWAVVQPHSSCPWNFSVDSKVRALAINGRRNPCLPFRCDMLEAPPEFSPPFDILGIDMAILECLRGPLHLVHPKLDHVDVRSSNVVCEDVHLLE
jgi:hypothetical protein